MKIKRLKVRLLSLALLAMGVLASNIGVAMAFDPPRPPI